MRDIFKRNLGEGSKAGSKRAARPVLTRAAALFFCVLMFAAGLSSCAIGQPKRFTDIYYDAFDTPISVIAYCKNEAEFKELSARVHKEFVRYHRIFDIYSEYEGLVNAATVNKAAGSGAPVKVPQELTDLLVFSKDVYRVTDGRVNVAMGAVLKLWHEAREYAADHPESAYIPKDEDLRAAAAHCSIDDMVVDAEASTVLLKDPQMSIDLGAVAKGWATERIAQMLKAEGRTSIAISAGGNVRVLGTRGDEQPWNIAIQDPSEGAGASDYIETVKVSELSVVTSGVNQRYFTAEGKRWHHIIDPDTLRPEDRFLSVTVMTEDSGIADALSTALFNMSLEDGRAFLRRLGNGDVKFAGFENLVVSAKWITDDDIPAK